VQACWDTPALGTITGADIANIFNTGTCQTWDNQNSVIRYQAMRSVLGLPSANYTVVVRMLADQNQPAAHTISTHLPITMHVDGVEIYNTPLPGNVLNQTGLRYETSFVNRLTDNRFAYYRIGWASVSTTAANLFSGRNYDTITNKIGAGVVFQTSGANQVLLYRRILTGYTRLEICATRVSNGSRQCAIHDNAGGSAYQVPINIPLFDATAHIVSITTIDAGAFFLDAVELIGSSVLQPGVNQETHAGITYSTTDGPLAPCAAPQPCPEYADWRDIVATTYNGGRARQTGTDNATVSFQFAGTGFSLITVFDTFSATVVNVNVTGPITVPDTFSLNSTIARIGSAYSLTGLPNGTYTVTLTEADPTTKHRMTLDAVEVYGTYDAGRVMPVGFYDSAQLNANGDTYLTLGPSNAAWTTRTGTLAATSLGQTNYNTLRYGGVTYFQVTGADAITLHHRSSTSTLIEVCAALTSGGDVPTCETRTLVGATSNTFTTPFNNGPGPNDYNVSITNITHALYLFVDGIGVHNTTFANGLTEGLFQENHPELTTLPAGFGGTWGTGPVAETVASDGMVRSTGTGDANDTLTFTFSGVGFAIVLSEGTTSSGTYTLNVDGTPENLTPVLPTAARRLVAISRVGLTNGLHTITLTNTDSTRPLLVDRVDILAQPSDTNPDEDINDGTTGNVQNNDNRIFYFPYVSMLPAANASASGGGQHTGSMQGSMAFFELDSFGGSQFQYVRQTSTTYGVSD
jgi:hypothetical protein